VDSRGGAGERACSRLSEQAASRLERSAGQPCDEAVLELGLSESEVVETSVWVTSAQVSLRTGDTVFLDETASGWRIGAAGCDPVPGLPYDCELEA
jgi:hypothetical protein